MTAILSNLQAIRAAIAQAAQSAQRDPAAITLLAVSKTVPASVIREAYRHGQTRFGENYLQEALDKIQALRDLPLEWHFIGPLQSNKTRQIAENFSWVHSVDRLKIAQRLAEQRPAQLPPLNICLQINISGESSKGGVSTDEAESLAHAIAALPHLKLRGLMVIPAPAKDLSAQRIPFAQLHELLHKLNAQGLNLDTLSMGMSHDLTAAIQEGATIVRVGTAIFGEAQKRIATAAQGEKMNICFIGGGNMASALIGGLLKRGFATAQIRVVEINPESCARLHNDFSIRASADLGASIEYCEYIVLAVKPQQLRELSLQLAPMLKGQLVISVAAGIRAQDLQRWLGSDNIVRAMPNTPALIRSGITGLYAVPGVSAAYRQDAQTIMAAVGSTLWLETEQMMDAVTAVSGSGPAYVFYFIEAMQKAALELGFNQQDARRLVLDTFMGATKLAESSTEDASLLRARVTSKNGTTERAILSMEASHVQADIIKAVHAAATRSAEMGAELGSNPGGAK